MRALFWLVLLAGCGSDVSPEQACTDYAAALCNKLNSCGAPLITKNYGDLMTCQMRAVINCPAGFMANGNAETPSRLDDCSKQAAMISCTQTFTRDTPMVCQSPMGKLADGNACGDDGQCMNAYCKKPSGQVCGVCSTRAAAGAACTVDADCVYTLACANSVCSAWVAGGGMCDAGHRCAFPNICKGGTCTAPGEAGQSCTPSIGGGDCDLPAGLFCHPTMLTCVQVSWATAGQPCGFVNNNIVGCSASGHCKITAPAVMGTCLAAAADGAACDAANGPDCMPPAQCVSGVCKLPNATSCM